MPCTWMPMASSVARRLEAFHSMQVLATQRYQGQHAPSSEGDGEGRRELILVVEDLYMQQAWCSSSSTDVAWTRPNTAPNSPMARGVAQDDAVQQAPLDVGQRYLGETSASLRRRATMAALLLVAALRLHERDQLARHEWEGDE